MTGPERWNAAMNVPNTAGPVTPQTAQQELDAFMQRRSAARRRWRANLDHHRRDAGRLEPARPSPRSPIRASRPPSARRCRRPPLAAQPSVLDNFLATHSGGTGAGGGYSNKGFFDTLNALRGGGGKAA